MFGGGYVEDAPIVHNREEGRVAFASQADWKDEATKARPQNGCTTQDCYKVKQKDLNSQIFEQTDNFEYLPLSKKSSETILRKTTQNGKKTQVYGKKDDKEFKTWAPHQEIAKPDYDAKARQQEVLQGNYFKREDQVQAPKTTAQKP